MDLPWIIFILVAFLVSCGTHSRADSDNDNSKKYCGGRLAEMLSQICRGNYNQMSDFRSYLVENPKFPFTNRKSASTLFGQRRRRRRGVTSECCDKPCSYEELQSYCASSTSTTIA